MTRDPFDADLRGRTALVTGAGAGIGRAIAHALAAGGSHIVVNDIDGDAAESVAQQLRAEHGDDGVDVVVGDVAKPSGQSTIVRKALAHTGRLDVLVNNAGIGHDVRPVGETRAESLARLLAVNLSSQILFSAEALVPMTRSGWGRIVNIGSRSWLGAPGQVDYSATKGGVVSFTRSLAAEVGPGITVNVVAPGTVSTPALERLDTATRDDLLARHPAHRFGTAEDVARTVRFLASPASWSITGHVLHVCGGRSIYGGRWVAPDPSEETQSSAVGDRTDHS